MKVNPIINLDSNLSTYINNQEVGGKYCEHSRRNKKIRAKELVLNEFRKERVREDHYNGNNVLADWRLV